MGAQSSKIARKLPTQPQSATLKNVPKESPSSVVHEVNTAPETSSLEREDDMNTTLLQHLSQLGPVAVPDITTRMNKSDTMLGIMEKRIEMEEHELPPGLGVSDAYVSIDSLYALLEQRKHLNPGEIDLPETRQQLMTQYKIDENTLSTLLKYYNTLAIMPPVLDDKEERRLGAWVNDRLDWKNKVKAIDDRNKALKKAKEEARKDTAKTPTKEDELKDLFDENY